MERKTGAITVQDSAPTVLDLCMAPGGYSATALKYNAGASARGISLPPGLGGHPVILEDPRVKVWLQDITMLAADLGFTEIPSNRPDRSEFVVDRCAYENLSFDLVFCDGQVLRTHAPNRETYRDQTKEATRLICSQLILALTRIKSGGTLAMLLHKAESFRTMALLRDFDKFANIELFKPVVGHARRSSFYLIAKMVQPDHPDAIAAKARWMEVWKAATFPELSTDPASMFNVSDHEVSVLLAEFGERLIELAEPVWEIQRKALTNAPWLRKKDGK